MEAARLLSNGFCVFSPIVHGYYVEAYNGERYDLSTWIRMEEILLPRFDKLVILRLPGWRESAGIAREHALALKHGLKIELLNPHANPSL